MQNEIFERVKLKRFKNKHKSKREIDLITQSNLIQLLIWSDENSIIYKHGRFRAADKENLVIYEHFAYDYYSSEKFPPIYALVEIFNFSFPQAVYLLNYFYYKVNKADVEDYIREKYKSSSSINVVSESVDLDFIIKEDGFIGTKSHYCYTRAIAYLCENRKIDKDIVLNFIKQGFLKMDALDNLCFITYKDAYNKTDVIAITRKGTNNAGFKGNKLKEHYTGFFYAKKDILKTSDIQTAYVFESCIDLMSFLTLIRNGRLLLPEDEACCYISLNGAGNKKYLQKVLLQYPSIEKIVLCLDNDNSGIKSAESIKNEYVLYQIGTPPNLETIYRYEFSDLRTILKDVSIKYNYCKDWNEALMSAGGFYYDISDFD